MSGPQHLHVQITVLPSDWANLITTFIEGGAANYWCKSAFVQTRVVGKGALSKGTWRRAKYSHPATYDGTKLWRLVVEPNKDSVGASLFDGATWGWEVNGKVRARYGLHTHDFESAYDRGLGLFARWLEGGARETSTEFDAADAERIIQLACFGVEVFG